MQQTIELIKTTWSEDNIDEDVTSQCLGPLGDKPGRAVLFSKEKGIFSGLEVLLAHRSLLPEMKWSLALEEGQPLESGVQIVEIEGTSRKILGIERTLLNFLSHLCGIATQTGHFVKAIEPHSAKLLCTRKTLPGLRHLELQAVAAGGGTIHRRSLSDGILIKENHSDITPIEEIVKRARAHHSPLHRIEIEVQSMEFLRRVLPLKPDIVMLDNFPLSEIPIALKLIERRCLVEVSGGVSLDNIGSIAATGVDTISVGQLTHSARALDLSLDISINSQ